MGFEALELANGDVKVEVVPARGAIVSSLVVAGTSVLALDRSTLDDPTKNVRGGVPVLFPFAGKLTDETLRATGTKMKQHGFGRNKPWRVVAQRAGFAHLALSPDDETRAQYPYNFEADYRIWVLPRGVEAVLTVENREPGARSLPISPGWHPYFRCPAAQKARVKGDVPGLAAERLGDDREFDFGIPAPVSGRARFEVPSLGAVRLSFSPEMRHLQFWSQPGKDFICIEPFFGPANTINTDARLDVAPGTARALSMRIELEG